jgi:hypothetical protein
MHLLPNVPTITYNGRTFYQIESASKYYVSPCGAVYSSVRNKILKPADNGIGYLQVWLLFDDGRKKWQKLHRLVATRFIPNPDGKTDVNHQDMVKANCHVMNLEWTTRKENIQHSYDSGRISKRGTEHHNFGKKLSAETKTKQSAAKLGEQHPRFAGWYVTPAGTFPSAQSAAEALDTYAKRVDRWCKGGQHKAEGYDFIPATDQPQALAQAA